MKRKKKVAVYYLKMLKFLCNLNLINLNLFYFYNILSLK